jgi:transcriptional regulator with XRE-family HTH domain
LSDIATIEARRKAHEISIGELCRVADIDRGTYARLQKVANSGRAQTLGKLDKALQALVEARAKRMPADV